MKFTSASVLAATTAVMVSSTTAAPVDTKIQDGEAFTLTPIGSGVPHAKFQAANNALYFDTPKQNSSCADINYATFRLDKGSLFLYAEKPSQQIVVDRSGMGQGIIQYTTGAQPIGRNQQRGPFGFDKEGSLKFLGQGQQLDEGFLACPNAFPAGYSVWLGNTGANNPGGNKGCVPVLARPTKVDKPVLCQYSQGH